MNEKQLLEKCQAFHGHSCGGMTIGFKASIYAMELLDIDYSADEDVVCITENDACGVDAIQVVLGCSVGKGNLLFHLTGKQAYSFYNRTTDESVRLVLKPRPANLTMEESYVYMQTRTPQDLFEVKNTTIPLPEPAKLFQSCDCEQCGESTAEHLMHLQNGKKLCRDCFRPYKRFDA